MAKLKAFVKSLDEVADQALRDLYVADKDAKGVDRFRLDAEGLEDVTGLTSALSAVRTEVRDLKKKTKPLEGLDDDADVDAIIAAGRAAIDAQKSGKPLPEVESVKSQLTAAHTKEVNKLNEQIAGMTDTLNEVLIANEVRAASGDETLKGNATLLLPHIEKEAKVVAVKDGDKTKFVAQLLGPDRQPRINTKTGNPITIKERLAEMRALPEYSDAFKGTGMSGSDTPPDGGSGTPTPPRTGPTARPEAMTQKRATADYGAI